MRIFNYPNLQKNIEQTKAVIYYVSAGFNRVIISAAFAMCVCVMRNYSKHFVVSFRTVRAVRKRIVCVWSLMKCGYGVAGTGKTHK